MESWKYKADQVETPENGKDRIPEAKMEELPDTFDALIVLGKNWREYPAHESPADQQRLHLSIESKMTALAAGEMLRAGITDTIIFSSGKTAGERYPSEARAMYEFMSRKFPDMVERERLQEGEEGRVRILFEEMSLDTSGNAEEVAHILEKEKLERVAALTVGFHMPRSLHLFNQFGIEVYGFPSEEKLRGRNAHYEKFVDRYLQSGRFLGESVKEMILRGILLVDRKGKTLRTITHKLRNPQR